MPTERVGIRKHPSYNHAVTSRKQAESELKHYCPQDSKCHFTWCKDSIQSYILSVTLSGKHFRHFNIITQGEGFEIEGGLVRFNDINSMLKYYQDTPIGDINGIGKCFKPLLKSISIPEEGGSGFRRINRNSKSLHLKHRWQEDVCMFRSIMAEWGVVSVLKINS
jgi:hypothetical protein